MVNSSINVSSEIILDMMEKFQIKQPIILNTNMLINKKYISYALKSLSFQGYSAGFSHKQIINPYQSYIIFINDLKDFKWNLKIMYAPVLVVVSQIKKEDNLKHINVSIGCEVLFLDLLSLKVYESYIINKKHIVKCLGEFQDTMGQECYKNGGQEYELGIANTDL